MYHGGFCCYANLSVPYEKGYKERPLHSLTVVKCKIIEIIHFMWKRTSISY